MFYITISNGLLEGDHQERMGSAIWQYMWIIDKITKIDEQGFGYVLGGKPINLRDLAICVTEDTVSRNLQKLQNEGYITMNHTPYGIQIKVAKAKKRFGKNVEPTSAKMSNPHRKNVEPNKTVSVDSTVGQGKPSTKEFFEKEEIQKKILDVLLKKGDQEKITKEFEAFINWWTEETEDGTKRWELENIFSVSARLDRWMSKAKAYVEFIKPSDEGIIIVGKYRFTTIEKLHEAEKDGKIKWDRLERKWLELA